MTASAMLRHTAALLRATAEAAPGRAWQLLPMAENMEAKAAAIESETVGGSPAAA